MALNVKVCFSATIGTRTQLNRSSKSSDLDELHMYAAQTCGANRREGEKATQLKRIRRCNVRCFVWWQHTHHNACVHVSNRTQSNDATSTCPRNCKRRINGYGCIVHVFNAKCDEDEKYFESRAPVCQIHQRKSRQQKHQNK